MANIRVDLDHELIDGQPVTFAAPCNCTEITGLKVYCPDGSQVFTFKDAHGNTLTGLGNLFSKGAYVKAILDTASGNAYLQNADTNAYLEAQFATKATVPQQASGDVISVADSGDAPLLGLKLYGKTTQNGTPTPTSPVSLESAGESGSVGVTVAGKNLLENVNGSGTHNGITYTVNSDGSITCAGTSTASNSFRNINNKGNTVCAISPGDYIISGGKDGVRVQVLVDDKSVAISENNNEARFTVPETATSSWVRLSVPFVGATINTTVCPMLRLASVTDSSYEPYKPLQTLTASTPNGLHGIGDVCDEIDFARGVRVRNLWCPVFDGSEDEKWQTNSSNHFFIVKNDMPYPHKAESPNISCSHFGQDAKSPCVVLGGAYGIQALNTGFTSLAQWKAFLAEQSAAGKPMTVVYELAQPIETPLSAEELAQYAALHSHKPNTTIFNDANADMEIRYCTPNAAVPMNVGSGANGKVLAVDEHGCVIPKDVTSIGAAPAGFGYRDTHDAEEAFMEVVENCLSQMSSDEVRHVSIAYYGRHSVMIHKHVNGYASIEDITYTWDTDYSKRVRTMYNNQWYEWEFVSPPMIIGNEYRTTERWNGHAVYTTIIDCGTPPSKSTKSVTMPSYVAPTRIIGWSGYVGHWGVSLPATASGWDVQITSDIIAIATDSDRSYDSTDNKVYITIKYTKD